jgi:hypothetical protein
LGTRVAFPIAKLKNKKASVQEIMAKMDEFVTEKSKKPIKIGITLLIENCSRGEKINIKKEKKSKVFFIKEKLESYRT